ncbi:MAG: hypothetical protein IPP52_09235 [Ignavibacteria bacterium]|nr:hypothetical protein [Ignavibacteria bacterium]
MKKFWILIFILCCSSFRLSAQQVNIPIKITDEFDSDTLRFGLDPAATDGIDAILNEAELPPVPPSGIFDARFTGEVIGIPIGEGLRKDYRNGNSLTSGVRNHRIKYKTGLGTTIRISWWNIPPGISVRIQDVAVGFLIDTTFTGTGSYLILQPLGFSSLNFTVTYNLLPLPATVNLKLIMEGFYNPVTNRLNQKDSCKAYLRQISSPYLLVDSSRAVIDSLTFNGTFVFSNASSGVYYIVIKHRNCLETWSKSGGVTITQGSSTDYDFTTSASQAFGSNLKLKGTKYCLYSGDCNQDGVVNSIDKLQIVNKLGNSGYIPEDINGNGFVNASDRSISVINLGKTKISP